MREAGARERVVRAKGMGLRSGSQSDVPLPDTGSVGELSQVLVDCEGRVWVESTFVYTAVPLLPGHCSKRVP